MRRFFVTISVLVTVVLAAGCGPDFAPYWQVDRLRVMAIQADPVVVKGGEPTVLRALVYDPQHRDIDYDWSWCPLRTSAQDDYECPVDAEDFGQFDNGGEEQGDQLSDEAFDLPDGEESLFFNPFEPEEIREFCEEFQREIIEEADDEQMAEMLPGGDCEEGYEISVRLEVTAGDDSVVATKRLMLWGGADEHNENPEFDEMQVRPEHSDDLQVLRQRAGWEVDEDSDREDQWVSVPADEDFEVVAGVPLEIRSLVDPDSLQAYTPAGADEPREEALEFSHFTTTSSLSSTTGLYSPGDNTPEDASLVFHSMNSDELHDDCTQPVDDGCRVPFWSVVRDSRLGVDWIQRRFLVHDENER